MHPEMEGVVSQRAICQAVRDYLKTERGYTSKECEFGFDGRPLPVWSGSRKSYFVAIHPGSWQPVGDPMSEALEEVFGVQITVTVKLGQVPKDRIGTNAYLGPAGESLDDELRAIIALLHHDKGAYPVLNAANTILGPSVNGFIEPLRFLSGGSPQKVGPDWFSAVTGRSTQAVAGLAQTLQFGLAKRIQVIEEQA